MANETTYAGQQIASDRETKSVTYNGKTYNNVQADTYMNGARTFIAPPTSDGQAKAVQVVEANSMGKHLDENGNAVENTKWSSQFNFLKGIACTAVGAYVGNKIGKGNLLATVIGGGVGLFGLKAVVNETMDDLQNASVGNDNILNKAGRFFGNVLHINGQNEAVIETNVSASDANLQSDEVNL